MTHEEAQATAATGDQLILLRRMSVTEAAARYRASETDVLKWIKAGLVPARKINGRWYIMREVSNG